MTNSTQLSLHPAVYDGALAEMRRKAKNRLYQRDFAAWQYDILGERTYAKMAEISQSVLTTPKMRALVKSANGTAKTFQAARWAMWWITAFDPRESLVIATAPTLRQVEKGVFSYIKNSYGAVKASAMQRNEPMPWPGWISEQNEWKHIPSAGGSETLALASVPGAADAVSTFQGLRKESGRNLILLDEAGGVSADIFTAIEALMTSGEARMGGIGNPDRRATPFYDGFNDPVLASEYDLHTISAYDLPTMTGEIVYPEDLEKNERMMRGLTSRKWIEHKQRVWIRNGKKEARFLAKVEGQFPGETDNAFFSEDDIVAAQERELPASGEPPIMGVDLAAMGDDESVVYVNRGGIARIFDEEITYVDGVDEDGQEIRRTTSGVWSKEDEVSSARRIHAIANHIGATEVRLDAAGLGGGVATMLMRLEEFAEAEYVVIRVIGSASSTDKAKWVRARDENHDDLRLKLRMKEIDLDPTDKILKDQMLAVTQDSDNHGALKITPKKLMRSEMHGSPDRLDALIYAVIDTSALTAPPLGEVEVGDVVRVDPFELLNVARMGAGMPI
ncbi:hypothetical protein G7068_16225 [Leucobacter viscericola]|uniref:Terminase n=1 Tax=Leucobacter viscericola TaxID=2714935 RepID=A0A6G7XJ02_9MICO|nr:hypothetical protein [Leucobacter viscericola]QIK64521.1 hypothetical protein G7068_15860 [Leucobacter viscericola]QIK64594.1 hypothetical protein G7068_16225 [Leucobacter viscericola]